MYSEYNPNPQGRRVGDCAVRAVAVALGESWDAAFYELVAQAHAMADMPSSDSVWGSVLRLNGFSRKAIPDECPECYTAEDFCNDHPIGTYVLAFGGHTATVIDGNLYDSWNSLHDIPQYYWYRKE